MARLPLRPGNGDDRGGHRRPLAGEVALPPESGLRPKDYWASQTPAASSARPIGESLTVAMFVAGIAAYVGILLGNVGTRVVDSDWGMLAGSPVWLLGLAALLGILVEHVRVDLPRSRADRGRLAELRRAVAAVDPNRIISIHQVPAHARRRFKLLVTIADHAAPADLDDALRELYGVATEMRTGRWRDPLANVPAPEVIEDPLDASVVERLNVAGFQRDMWAKARASHDAVRQEWTEVLVDRLSVLDHPLLLDVSQPSTAAFITAYGRVQDFRSIHGEKFDPALVDQYAALAREAAAAWTTAKSVAEDAGAAHLPEADQALIREAMELLERADDETLPVRRRVRATQRAARLMAKVESLQLPDDFLV